MPSYTRKIKCKLPNKPLKLGVMATFKNEAMGIREWIEHYLWQGVSEFLLINNGSTDNWQDKITGLEQFLTIKSIPKRHAQVENYNKFGPAWFKEKKIDAVVIIDLDEYIFCKNNKNIIDNLADIFLKPNHPSEIRINWTMFGSNGYRKQPDSIRKSFTIRKRNLDKNIKAIVWTKDIKPGGIHVHYHSLRGKTIKRPSIFQLNHYAIQSKEFFTNVKMTRGSANTKKHENVRDWKYFKKYDYKDKHDEKLKSLVENSNFF
jgi:hypothetical protein